MMISNKEHGRCAQCDDDVAHLRALLKPFDPANQPRPAQGQSQPSVAPGGVPTRPRRRTGVLIAAAIAAVIAAALIPTLVINQNGSTTDQRSATASAFTGCQQRAKTTNLTTSGPTPANRITPDEAQQPADRALARWYSTAKERKLSSALRVALPAGTCVFLGSGMGDLRFPAPAIGDFSIYDAAGTLAPSASGRLVTASGDGTLMMGVYPAAAGPASCVTGKVDKQVTAADGTLISQTQTTASMDATRWTVLLVQAYRPSGSCVWLRLSDEVLRHDTSPTGNGMTASGSTPLNMNQLTAMASAPGLDTSG